MKIRLLLTLLGAAALTVSCIKDEPLNAEADIIECTVPGDIVKTDPKIADNTVMILIVPGSTDVTRMAPEFKLTPGAVIEPASGTVRDFTTPKLYKVTSQDGRCQRDRNRPADPVQFRRLERDRKIRTALRNHRRGCGPRDMVVRKCGLRADRRRIRPEQISDLFHPDRPRGPAGGQTRNQIDRDVRFGPEHADRRREPVHRNVRRYAGYQKWRPPGSVFRSAKNRCV